MNLVGNLYSRTLTRSNSIASEPIVTIELPLGRHNSISVTPSNQPSISSHIELPSSTRPPADLSLPKPSVERGTNAHGYVYQTTERIGSCCQAHPNIIPNSRYYSYRCECNCSESLKDYNDYVCVCICQSVLIL